MRTLEKNAKYIVIGLMVLIFSYAFMRGFLDFAILLVGSIIFVGLLLTAVFYPLDKGKSSACKKRKVMSN